LKNDPEELLVTLMLSGNKGKIINDPVYGFLHFREKELLYLISHPWFQRLRHIRQMAMAHLVYPGAVHTRLHHSLGAAHLIGKALDELRRKGIDISEKEHLTARMAMLLHDIGHGPFSHALEHTLVPGISHESLSHTIIQHINVQSNGMLDDTIRIFEQKDSPAYLHQLVSSQLDMDRMDYLNRDSFFTGVSEGVIGYDRILHMLTVQDGTLMVEEKGVHSVEKFIIARRLMYWQVYLHKTVLSAEQLLVRILTRGRELAMAGEKLFATPALHHFLYNEITPHNFHEHPEHLEYFCALDDSDVLASIKVWQQHSDFVLSTLCRMLMQRQLYKTILSSKSLDNLAWEHTERLRKKWQLTDDELSYFVFTGITTSDTYNMEDERITILLKNGTKCDISEVENALVNQALAKPVQKNYICYTSV
jgi:HD superfamily phosphohydrolase